MAVVEEAGEAVPALEHVIHRLGHGGVARERGTLGPHPVLELGDHRRAPLAAHREAPLGSLAVDLALDVEQRVDPLHRLQSQRRDRRRALAARLVRRDVGELVELAPAVRPTQRLGHGARRSVRRVDPPSDDDDSVNSLLPMEPIQARIFHHMCRLADSRNGLDIRPFSVIATQHTTAPDFVLPTTNPKTEFGEHPHESNCSGYSPILPGHPFCLLARVPCSFWAAPYRYSLSSVPLLNCLSFQIWTTRLPKEFHETNVQEPPALRLYSYKDCSTRCCAGTSREPRVHAPRSCSLSPSSFA